MSCASVSFHSRPENSHSTHVQGDSSLNIMKFRDIYLCDSPRHVVITTAFIYANSTLCLVITALDSWLYGRGFNSRPPQQILGYVTVFGHANHISIAPSHQGQLNLLSSAGREMSTIQKCGDALRLGSKGRYGSFHLWINVWVAGKAVWSLVNTCHSSAPTQIGILYLYFYSLQKCSQRFNQQQNPKNRWDTKPAIVY